MAADVVDLPAHGTEGQMWAALVDLADTKPQGWTIVGALMVMLLAHEHGHGITRTTRDLDTLVAARGVVSATRTFSDTLVDLGWTLDNESVTAGAVGFTFSRQGLRLDLLAPEGLGARADLTTISPLRTVPIDGGSQALQRTESVPVSIGGRTGRLPRPDLLGALVLKSCAAHGDRTNPDKDPARHLRDLGILYSLVEDPRRLRDATTAKDRQRLRRVEPHWADVADRQRSTDARLAHQIILGA